MCRFVSLYIFYIWYMWSMSKRVRNVTAMESWWRLVTYHSCFMLYKCIFVPSFRSEVWSFTLHCDLLWSFVELNSFRVILSIMRQNPYTRFCWFITTDSRRSRRIKIPRTQLQYLIKRLIVRSRKFRSRKICIFNCPIALKFDRHLSSNVKNT